MPVWQPRPISGLSQPETAWGTSYSNALQLDTVSAYLPTQPKIRMRTERRPNQPDAGEIIRRCFSCQGPSSTGRIPFPGKPGRFAICDQDSRLDLPPGTRQVDHPPEFASCIAILYSEVERGVMLDREEECRKTTTFFPGNPLLDSRGGHLRRHSKSPLQCDTRLGMGPVWDRIGRDASSGHPHVFLLGRALPHTRHPGLFSR